MKPSPPVDTTPAKPRQFKSVSDAVWHCKKIGGSAKLIALRLVEHMPDDYPSMLTIAEWCGLSERTVREALRELEAKRIVETRRTGRSNVYVFAFAGVSIPELGAPSQPPPDAAPSGGSGEPGAPPETPGPAGPIPAESAGVCRGVTPAESADQIGRTCRSDRQLLPVSDPPKSDPSPISRSSFQKRRWRKGETEGGASATPPARRSAPGTPPTTTTTFFTSFSGWKLSDSLRAEIIAAGIRPADVDRRVKRFTNSPFASRGVLDLDDYIREQIPKWLAWQADEDADSRHKNGVSSAFGGVVAGSGPTPTSGASKRRLGALWIHADHVAFAASAGLDLAAEQRRFRRGHHQGSLLDGMPPAHLYRPFMDHLRKAAQEKAA